MAFSVLMHEYPLTLMKIRNTIDKRYGKAVSFQAVRKAVLQLGEEGVLEKTGKEFQIRKDWIVSIIKFGNLLQNQYFTKDRSGSKIETAGNAMTYELPSLVDLDYVWNNLIREALAAPGTSKTITFKAVHFWFLIATLAQETELIQEMVQKGIKLHYICYGNTPLDKWAVETYKRMGVHAKILPKPRNFPQGLNIGTYGNKTIQSQHPPELAAHIDTFFKTCKHLQDASLADITSIVMEKCDIRLQVLNDPVVTETIREEIAKQTSKS